MPAFFDEHQFRNALRIEGLPVLEHLAENPEAHGHALRRFERDEPPPYPSSESDEEGILYHPAIPKPSNEAILEQFYEILEPPITDEELDAVVHDLHGRWEVYSPGRRYEVEARAELKRLGAFQVDHHSSQDLRKYFDGELGRQRENVIVRYLIRRRWEKLGIWNPVWGIPGRVDGQEKDHTENWRWSWQHEAHDHTRWRRAPSITDEQKAAGTKWHLGREEAALNPQHPITRAVQLRRTLRRGQHSPLPPRSHLENNPPPELAESFIISRPWFQFAVEATEEERRLERIPKLVPPYRGKPRVTVHDWWKDRGYPLSDTFRSWKWPYESPAPEPEDLTPLLAHEMEYSPSEVDALEALEPPPLSTNKASKLMSTWELPDTVNWDIWPRDAQSELGEQNDDPVQLSDELTEQRDGVADENDDLAGQSGGISSPSHSQEEEHEGTVPDQQPRRSSSDLAATSADAGQLISVGEEAEQATTRPLRQSRRLARTVGPPQLMASEEAKPKRGRPKKNTVPGADPWGVSRKDEQPGVVEAIGPTPTNSGLRRSRRQAEKAASRPIPSRKPASEEEPKGTRTRPAKMRSPGPRPTGVCKSTASPAKKRARPRKVSETEVDKTAVAGHRNAPTSREPGPLNSEKRSRGRPRKPETSDAIHSGLSKAAIPGTKGRGRPRKAITSDAETPSVSKTTAPAHGRRGRPKKTT